MFLINKPIELELKKTEMEERRVIVMLSNAERN